MKPEMSNPHPQSGCALGVWRCDQFNMPIAIADINAKTIAIM
jgi:hypothetical protein